MRSTLLVLLLSQAERPDSPTAGTLPPPHPPSMAGGWRYLIRLEATGLALLPGGGMGGVESYAQLTPMLVVDGALGAEVFGWGRVDVDGCLAAQLANRNLEVALSGLALGLGVDNAR